MKKMLTWVLAVLMIVSAMVPMTMAEEAATAATIEVGTAEAYVGKENVEVTISIKNNPGVGCISVTIDYDMEALTLAEVTNGALFSTLDVDTNLLWSADNNVTVDGVLATLTFNIADNAAVDSYPISLKINECTAYEDDTDNTNSNMLFVDLAAEAGKIVVGERVSVIETAQAKLGTDISVIYKAELLPEHAGAQMKFTMSGLETTVDGVTEGEYTYYTYTGVAPQSMGDNIKAELILGDEVLACEDGYSVKQYCLNMLNSSADALGLSADKFAALQTLVKDMLVYGAKAQLYRGHMVNNLVDEGITGSTFVPVGDDYAKYIEGTSLEGLEVCSFSCYFDYTNSLSIRFVNSAVDISTVKIRLTDTITGAVVVYGSDSFVLEDETNAIYRLTVDPLSVLDYETLYMVELCTARKAGVTEMITPRQMGVYGLVSYIHSMQNKTEGGELTAMAELARATYNYGKAAVAYANAQ